MYRVLPRLSLVGLVLLGCGGAEAVSATGTIPTTPCPSTSGGSVSAKGEESPRNPLHVDAVAEELLRRINAKDGSGVVALFGESMRKAFPVDKTGPFIGGLVEAKGTIKKLSREEGHGNEHEGVYRFKAERGEWRVEVHVDDAGKVTGFAVTEPPPPDPAVAKSTIELGLPYRGQWSVFWGGDKLEVNAHVNSKSQRRAVDLDVAGPDGKTYRSDGKANQDYYAYGREVLAVADGVVVTQVDGVPENQPGELNSYFVPGNLVVVKHSNNLFSAYAHLQPGKLRVKVGTSVKRGAVLGLCGNSGNSSEPHLHFQLQDGPQFEKSWGVEAVFRDVQVVRDGKPARMSDYTFLKGDLVGDAEKK